MGIALNIFNDVKKFGLGFFLDFSIVLCTYFAQQLLVAIYKILSENEFDTPFTFSFLWVGILLFIPFIKLEISKKSGNRYVEFLFIAFFAGGISLMITSVAWGKIFEYTEISFEWDIIERKYIGIEGKDYNEDQTSSKSYPGFVFDINNSQIESEWERNNSQIENEWERNSYAHQYTSSRHFIFWQTALADGFNPKYVSSYNCCNSLFDRIVLYCTVGPLRILEALIEAFEITLRFLIIPFIMRLFGKPLFFDDFKSFLKYVSK